MQNGDVEADAVWDSNHGLAAEERKAEAKTTKKPGFGAKTVEAQLPKLREMETSKSPFTGIGAPKKGLISSG